MNRLTRELLRVSIENTTAIGDGDVHHFIQEPPGFWRSPYGVMFYMTVFFLTARVVYVLGVTGQL